MVKNAIKVYARLKPENNRKYLMNYKICHRPKEHSEEDFLVLIASRKSYEYIDHRPETWNFSFCQVFDVTVDQNDVFENVALPVVQSTLNGYNGTIFAYGQTGSGKTFSITGDKESYDDRGIIPRTLQYVFNDISQHPENVYSVEVAYLEIYNENGYDLLDRKSAITRLEDLPRVTIQEDESGKLHLKNLIFHRVESEEDALEMLLIGDANRITAETPMNPQSSRSHCIFTVVISVKQFAADSYKRAKMHLVDLAGSERVYKCAISGTTLTEAKHINLSLHYLEQVIVCLGQETASHIPYRNSLLTAILRDSLGGNCLTTMLATLSVTSINAEETISTCRFAQRVALVRNDVNLALDNSTDCENALLRLENQRLRKRIEELQAQTVDSSREFTDSEKKTLDCRVEGFVNSSDNVAWDNDPRKFSYCLNRSKNSFLFAGSKEVLKKLEHYKKLLAQRDKEISLLSEMLRKERMKNSNIDVGLSDTNNALEESRLLENSFGISDSKSEVFTKKENRILRANRHKAIATSSRNPNQLVDIDSSFTATPCKILNINLDNTINNDNGVTKDSGLLKLKSSTDMLSTQNLTSSSSHRRTLKVGESTERKSHRKQETCTKYPVSQSGKENESNPQERSSGTNTIFSPATSSTVQQTQEINFPRKKTNVIDAETKRTESTTAFDFINKHRGDLQAKLTARNNTSIIETKSDANLLKQSIAPKNSYSNLVQSSKECELSDCTESTRVFVDSRAEIDGRGINVSKACELNDREFQKTLPLTGDSEIDEEIIAFYMAKRLGGTY